MACSILSSDFEFKKSFNRDPNPLMFLQHFKYFSLKSHGLNKFKIKLNLGGKKEVRSVRPVIWYGGKWVGAFWDTVMQLSVWDTFV